MTDLLQTVFFVFFAGLLGTVLIGALSRDPQAVANGVASVVTAALPTLSDCTNLAITDVHRSANPPHDTQTAWRVLTRQPIR